MSAISSLLSALWRGLVPFCHRLLPDGLSFECFSRDEPNPRMLIMSAKIDKGNKSEVSVLSGLSIFISRAKITLYRVNQLSSSAGAYHG